MVNLIGFEPGTKSNTLKDSIFLTSTPGIELDNLAILDPLLTTINAQVPPRLPPVPFFPLSVIFLIDPLALDRSLANPNAIKVLWRSCVLVIDSIASDATIG